MAEIFIEKAQELLPQEAKKYADIALSQVIGYEERRSLDGVTGWFGRRLDEYSIEDALSRYHDGYDTEEKHDAVLVITLVEDIAGGNHDREEKRDSRWWREQAKELLMKRPDLILDTLARTTYYKMYGEYPKNWKLEGNGNVI